MSPASPSASAPPATSREDDRLIIRRAARRLWICLAVVIAAFAGPAFVPVAWKARIVPARLLVPYANPNAAMPQEASVNIGAGYGANVGVVIWQTIHVRIWPLGGTSEQVVTDEATIASARKAFVKDNAPVLGAEAGPLFNRAVASPSGDAMITYGWRNFVSGVLMALGFGFYAALIVAFYATRALLAAKRRSRLGLCTQCGYDLQGLSPLSPCPECGSVRALAPTNWLFTAARSASRNANKCPSSCCMSVNIPTWFHHSCSPGAGLKRVSNLSKQNAKTS